MIIYYFKLISDLSLYAAIITCGQQIFHSTILFQPLILTLSLGPFISRYISEELGAKYRYFDLVPIVSSFFVSEFSLSNILIIIPIAIYMAALVIKKDQELEYYSYVKQSRVFAVIGIIYLMIMGYSLILYNGTTIGSLMPYAYYAIFFSLSVVIARSLRYGNDKVGGKTAIRMVAGAVLVSGVSVAVNFFDQYIYMGIRSIFAVLLIPFLMLEQWAEKGKPWVFRLEEVGSEASDGAVGELAGTADYYEDNLKKDFNIIPVIIVVIILAIAVILYFAIKVFNNKRALNRMRFKSDGIEDVKKVKVKREPQGSNRIKVRRIYRQFISILLKQGIVIRDSLTSEEILELLNGMVSYEAAEALRNVYIRARYNNYADVKEEEVRVARKALRLISTYAAVYNAQTKAYMVTHDTLKNLSEACKMEDLRWGAEHKGY